MFARPAAGTTRATSGWTSFRGPHLFTVEFSRSRRNFRHHGTLQGGVPHGCQQHFYNQPGNGLQLHPGQYLYRLALAMQDEITNIENNTSDAAPDVLDCVSLSNKDEDTPPPRRGVRHGGLLVFFCSDRRVCNCCREVPQWRCFDFYSHRLLAGALGAVRRVAVGLQASSRHVPKKDGLTQGASSAPQDASLERSTPSDAARKKTMRRSRLLEGQLPPRSRRGRGGNAPNRYCQLPERRLFEGVLPQAFKKALEERSRRQRGGTVDGGFPITSRDVPAEAIAPLEKVQTWVS